MKDEIYINNFDNRSYIISLNNLGCILNDEKLL